MKIVMPGGSGQVGTVLARAFHGEAHEVVVLSRRPRAGTPWRVVVWDPRELGEWVRELDGARAVVNLAGRSVDCRYGPRQRREILESRVASTAAVGRAVAACERPPEVWLQASTATIYAHRFDAPNDERGPLGGCEPGAPAKWGFSIEVAKAWESEAQLADTPSTRKVLLRSAMTMSPDRGGIFDRLLALVRLGLGGRAGDGRQYVSWIHELDFVRAVRWLIEREDLAGPVNVASPNPLPNAEFMAGLRSAWGRRVGLPATHSMLELGALALRTETELVLKSRRVVPGILLQSGFEFAHPEWPGAARDLCRSWRERRRSGGLAPAPAAG